MSNGDLPPARPDLPPVPPPSDATPLPLPPPRSGWMTAFMVLVGIVLLLPGLCAVIFGVVSLSDSRPNPTFTPFIVVGLLVGFGGIMLIRSAIRGPQP